MASRTAILKEIKEIFKEEPIGVIVISSTKEETKLHYYQKDGKEIETQLIAHMISGGFKCAENIIHAKQRKKQRW